MKANYYFKVADCVFGLFCDFQIEIESVLPSYRNFVIDDASADLFTMQVYATSQDFVRQSSFSLIVEDTNDMGHLLLYKGPDNYCLVVGNSLSKKSHVMFASADFKEMTVFLREGDPFWGDSLNSMIRFAFSQAILSEKGASIHASAVCVDGDAYIFMGKSGTGKSTHARLWKQYVKGAKLLNDDHPVIRLIEDGRIMVYGTPWSGKTPCYINGSAELKGAVRLQQADKNRFVGLTGVEAFLELLPGCMAFPAASGLYEKLCDLLEVIANSSVVIGRLYCLPQKEAAFVCYHKIK